MREYDVFISYRRDGGKDYARNLELELEKRGYHPFLDVDELQQYGRFDRRIMNAIESAPVFLSILTPNCLDRCVDENDWVRKEILHAVNCQRHIVPVNIDRKFAEFPKSIDFPKELKNALGQHQFWHIDTEQLYRASVDRLVSECIEPFLPNRRNLKELVEECKAVIRDMSEREGILKKEIRELKDRLTLQREKIDQLEKEIEDLRPRARGLELEEGELYTIKDVQFRMIPIKGGSYVMGVCNDRHHVELSDFLCGETPVTQALWQTVMGANPSRFPGKDRPVDNVSWDDCQEFIRILNDLTGKNFRLPTEAEWEYAARGGQKSRGFQYAGSSTISGVAWCKNNSEGRTHAVKTKLPNELGLYDMSGNVYEWCQDWYGQFSKRNVVNPKGVAQGIYRVRRGGCYRFDVTDCSVTTRKYSAPDCRKEDFGLRLVLSVDE